MTGLSRQLSRCEFEVAAGRLAEEAGFSYEPNDLDADYRTYLTLSEILDSSELIGSVDENTGKFSLLVASWPRKSLG